MALKGRERKMAQERAEAEARLEKKEREGLAWQQKERERMEKYVNEVIDKEIYERFPPTSGPVLRTTTDNKKWIDFIDPNKKK